MNPDQQNHPAAEENTFATDSQIEENRSVEELTEIIFENIKDKIDSLVNHFKTSFGNNRDKRNFMINEVLRVYQTFKLVNDRIQFLSSKDGVAFYQTAEKIYDELLAQNKLPAELSFPKSE